MSLQLLERRERDVCRESVALEWYYLGVTADVFSTDARSLQKPVNLAKFIFFTASAFYNGAFNLFSLCLLGFLCSGTLFPPYFSGSEHFNDYRSGNMGRLAADLDVTVLRKLSSSHPSSTAAQPLYFLCIYLPTFIYIFWKNGKFSNADLFSLLNVWGNTYPEIHIKYISHYSKDWNTLKPLSPRCRLLIKSCINKYYPYANSVVSSESKLKLIYKLF